MAGRRELVLYYRPQGAVSPVRLKGVLARMGIRIRNIQESQLDEKVGFLAGADGYGKGASGENTANAPGRSADSPGEAPEEEMLVMCGFGNKRLEEFLLQLRKAGAPRINRKAVLTETNASWTLRELYAELGREHEAMQRRRQEGDSGTPQ